MTREFTVVREFDAPRELVFRAWTDPDQFTQWCGPQGAPSGDYKELVEPERLVFAWGDPTGTGTESLITITFDDRNDKTLMTFHLLAPGPLSSKDTAEVGWGEAFDALEQYLGAGAFRA